MASEITVKIMGRPAEAEKTFSTVAQVKEHYGLQGYAASVKNSDGVQAVDDSYQLSDFDKVTLSQQV